MTLNQTNEKWYRRFNRRRAPQVRGACSENFSLRVPLRPAAVGRPHPGCFGLTDWLKLLGLLVLISCQAVAQAGKLYPVDEPASVTRSLRVFD